ncbi:hypothetical protein GF371_05475 [Candidatus Woesearchaeota archaeon]|nr:hypothetical protein [Candidatus Woesearchaeota archaeon]
MKRILLALMIIALVLTAVGCAKKVAEEEPAEAEKKDSVAEVGEETAALEEMEQNLDPDNVEGLDDIGSLFEDY